ncbi:hypothetical protein AB1K91_18000 [Terribacillus sp. 179-K 1B1 HS]|uniref:hypothetical protein n=1 Tax=Terribacillus sp. 179-K 1B1 HS TaxID=3142388 RepID=UPI0039A249BD
MQNEIGYALTRHIGDRTGVKVVQIFDGISLPTEKPFVTVEALANAVTKVSKQRESMRKTYRFQIGLYAKSLSDRNARQDELERLFLFEKFPLYQNPSQPATGSFLVDLINATPIPSDKLEDENTKFRVFFDIEVTTYLRK